MGLTQDEWNLEERRECESVDRSKYGVDDVVPRETCHDGQRY